uniref:YqbQ/XkdQ domain-containing protein n=1 Tax=viral metagenome TaxID=1070528 RepID=A0A6M3JR47_9ZZZZ
MIMTSIPTARVTIPIRIFPKVEKGEPVGSVTINGEEVKARMTRLEVNRRVTVGIDTAKITLANLKQQYGGKWSGGETAIVLLDYSGGTTKIFEGYVLPITDGFDRYPSIEISCSGYGVEAFKNPVYKRYTTATDIGQIAKELIEEYLPAHTTTNINTSTGVTATPVWQGKDLWHCLYDLAVTEGDNNYDFCCDFDKDWHFFVKGSRVHDSASGVAVVYGQNHRKTRMNSIFDSKYNKITVVGQDKSGQKIKYTWEDSGDISDYWKMAKVVRNTNLTTLAEVKAEAEKQVAIQKDVGRSGKVISDGVPGLLPGYKVMVYDPHNQMNDYFVASEAKHTLASNNFETETNIHEHVPKYEAILEAVGAIKDNEQKSLSLDDEHGLENSFPVFFDDTSQMDTSLTSSNVTVSNGRLTLASGESGTFVSVLETARGNVTKGLIKVNGSDIEDCTFQVSINNYVNSKTMTPRTLYDFDGSDGRIRVIIILQKTADRRNPSIESVGLEYR